MNKTWTDYYEYMLRWVQNTNWQTVGIVIAFAVLLVYIAHLKDPRRWERAMARREEDKKAADIVSAALQDACHRGEFTASAWHRQNRKLARVYPDMVPRKKFPGVKTALKLSTQRLTAMGVNIADGLSKMRRRRPSKQERVTAAIKSKP